MSPKTTKELADEMEARRKLVNAGYLWRSCQTCRGTGRLANGRFSCHHCNEQGGTWEQPMQRMSAVMAVLMAFLLACCSTTPPAPPTPQPTGNYQIHEIGTTGHILKTYQVSTYTETEFPRCVSFIHNGTLMVLTGSYQIDEFLR